MGKRVDIRVKSNALFYADIELVTEQNVSDWQHVGYLYDAAVPAVAEATITTALDASTKLLNLQLSRTTLATLLPEGEDEVTFLYQVKLNPGLTEDIEIVYGEFIIERGGPE